MEDAQIITLYWNRDESAISSTDAKYGRFCQSIAMNILSVVEDSEECVNDTYQKAWCSIPPERPLSLKAWLGKVVRNLAISRFRYNKAKKRNSGAEELLSELEDCLPDFKTTEDAVEAREVSNCINGWLETLTSSDRAIFIRRYWNGEDLQELSKTAGMSSKTLAVKLHRMRNSLKDFLERKGIAV